MGVDSLGWYIIAARMAIALAERKIPFEFENQKNLLDVLQGTDDVEVGPDLYSVKYGDLKKNRPDVLRCIRWDPIPQMNAISPDQSVRIKASCKE